MYKKLLANSAIYGILPQLPKVASLFVLPLITPFLTKVDYGVMGTIGSYIYATSVLQLLGLEVVIFNAYYHHPSQYKWYWRQLFGFTFLWSLVYIALVSLLLYFIIPPEASQYKWQIIGMRVIPLLLFGPAEMLATAYYILKQKAWPIASRALLAGFISVALNYYFIAQLKMGYYGWMIADFISGMISGIIFCLPLFTSWKLTPIFNFKWRLIKQALKVSLPVIPHNYSSYMLDSSDRLIMERFGTPTAEIGRYSLAYSFGKYTDTVTNALNQAIGPSLLNFIREKKWKDYARLTFSFQALMLITCFTLSLWVPQWLPLLVRNKELLDINYLVAVIVMSYSYRPMYIGCVQIAFYYEKTKILWRITFVAGVINIILNLIFIPFFGIMAAACSTFIAFLFVGFVGFTFPHYKDLKEIRLLPLLWLSIICALMMLCLFLINESTIIKILINGGVIISLIWVVIKIGNVKITTLKQVISESGNKNQGM